jgi:hypothetical protein
MRGVSSTLALSAMVIRTWYGKLSLRYRCSLRTESASAASSL